MLRALLLAPPGAGKGTQGERLATAFGVAHLATGDILREHVANQTALGREAQSFMDAGELVPDRLVNVLVGERIAGREPLAGFVLDGFPRTLGQAQTAYDWGLANERTFHAVISLVVQEDELVRRLLERGELAGRTDDTERTIRHRLEVYADNATPLLAFYEERGIILEVDGTGSVEDVESHIVGALADQGLTPDAV